MSRTFETLMYGIVAAVLVTACLYGLARYADSAAPTAPAQAAYVPPPPSSVYRNPAPSVAENVVRTATRTYYLPPASPARTDVDTYNNLRNNCFANARGNSEGEFPALQQAACDRFTAFARSRGWDTGTLPAYGTPRPQPRGEQVAVIGQSQPVDSGECAALYQAEQEVEAALRAGYQEPEGNWLRARQRELQEELWRSNCPRR